VAFSYWPLAASYNRKVETPDGMARSMVDAFSCVSSAVEHAVGTIHPLGEGRSEEAERHNLIC
jgi:hypothetical protein